jgi:endonuclease/exonuclease/phosphatase family metal-dependent hydrolase
MLKPFLCYLSLFLFAILSTSAQEINVLTYNIRFASFDSGPQNWDQRKEGVITLLKGHDFIGLQEVLPVQMDDIKASLGNDYGYIFRSREEDPTKGEGSPVLYNKTRWALISSEVFWLSDTPEVIGSNTWGAAFNRIVSYGFFRDYITGNQVLVINTHFDHISQPAREKSIKLILEKFKVSIPLIPVIFMGDLNVTPENPVYGVIVSSSLLTDSYLSVNKDENNSAATFHGWKPETPVNRIDYIFISPFLETISSEVIHYQMNSMYPSDHFPVKSILKIKK